MRKNKLTGCRPSSVPFKRGDVVTATGAFIGEPKGVATVIDPRANAYGYVLVRFENGTVQQIHYTALKLGRIDLGPEQTAGPGGV